MIYHLIRDVVLDLLKCPKEPPEPPAGSHASVHMFRASRSFLQYRLLQVWLNLLVMVALLAGGVFFGMSDGERPGLHGMDWVGLSIFAFFAAFNVIVSYITIRLDYDMRYYIVTDRSLRIREGVWKIRETTLTFDNIQNMKRQQGPLQRLFGIYDLVVETAGGGGSSGDKQKNDQTNVQHRGTFRGIKRPEALRDLILAYLRRVQSSGLGYNEEERLWRRGARRAGGAAIGKEELAVLRQIAEEISDWRGEVESRPETS